MLNFSANQEAAYNVLKPGGVFGITGHRALPYANAIDVAHRFHRISEGYVINAGVASGFRLAGVSGINANPKDPLDISVSKLPPALDALPDQRAKMGDRRSDYTTIRFVNP